MIRWQGDEMARDQDNELERGQKENHLVLGSPGSAAPRFFFVSLRHPIIPSRHSQANRSDHVLDWIERSLVLILYAWLVFRIVSSYTREGELVNLLLLPSEGLVVFFMLIRRRAASITRHFSDWVVALLAACTGLLVVPVPGHALVSVQLAGGVLLAGIFVQVLAKIALGRSIGCVPAHRGLKVSGPYRFIRHPMYAGYLLSDLAFLAVNANLWNAGIYAIGIGLQLYRLRAEERMLTLDPKYVDYRRQVRYRLVPGLF
jgi:protein-S-isoprenylcysteine O-methyltransferase Ste14